MPRRIANDPEQFRFRTERQAGSRSVIRTIGVRSAPRAMTSGDQAEQTSGGSIGIGFGFGNPFGTIPDGSDSEIPDAGDPDTGKRVAIWDHFAWDSTIDLFGA